MRLVRLDIENCSRRKKGAYSHERDPTSLGPFTFDPIKDSFLKDNEVLLNLNLADEIHF